MADPLSITASVLAVVTAAAQSTRSLYETIKRFNDRDSTLQRLRDELQDLTKILESLAEAVSAEDLMIKLLRNPIERCSQQCQEFEQTMKVFKGKSKAGFLDWTRMEFKKGTINEFIDNIARYKSTISIGIGTVTLMRTSKVSPSVLEEYNERIQDTLYNLELHLRRVEEKMTQSYTGTTGSSSVSIDLQDEREVTKQCLRICEDARSYIESLSSRESSLLPEAPQTAIEDIPFETQLRTRRLLDGNLEGLVEHIGFLNKRLDFLRQTNGPEKDALRSDLEKDINISKQCMDVCKAASEISHQKVYRVGEVVAEGESDQVVVTTLADLFDVRKALSKDNSAQLVGSMTSQDLQLLSEKRYNSRFGSAAGRSDTVETGTTNESTVFESPQNKTASVPQSAYQEQSLGAKSRQSKPSPNEMRKRHTDCDRDDKEVEKEKQRK